MQTYRSRKRKLETVIKAALEDLFAEGLDGVQIVLGRETTERQKTHIRIHCGESEPTSDEDQILTGFRVNGTITILTTVDDKTRDQHDELEGIVESFCEIETEELVSLLNQQNVVHQFGVWEFQPLGSEDDVDDDLRRFFSVYRFTAVVQHETQTQLITTQ